eukprot:m51a1_g9157 putative serine threonine protein kinase (578) ;mRNA; f:130192-132347
MSLHLPAEGRAVADYVCKESGVALTAGERLQILETKRSGGRKWVLVATAAAGERRAYVPTSVVEVRVHRHHHRSGNDNDNTATPQPSPATAQRPQQQHAEPIAIPAQPKACRGKEDKDKDKADRGKKGSSMPLARAQPASPLMAAVPPPPGSTDAAVLQRPASKTLGTPPRVQLSALPSGRFNLVAQLAAPLVVASGVEVTLVGGDSGTTAVAITSPGREAAVTLSPGSKLTATCVTLGLSQSSGDGAVLVASRGPMSALVLTECSVVGTLWARDGSSVVLERCSLRVPRGPTAGIIATGAATVVRALQCRVHKCSGGGALAASGGVIALTECALTSNRVAAAMATSSSRLSMSQTKVEDCQLGVWYKDRSQGVVEDCEFRDNKQAAVMSESGSRPVLQRCVFTGGQAAVISMAKGDVLLEDSDVASGTFSGLYVKGESRLRALRCTIRDGAAIGVAVHRASDCHLELCEVKGHALAGVNVESGASVTVARCRVRGGPSSSAVQVVCGSASLSDTDVHASASGVAAVSVEKEAAVQMHTCRVVAGHVAVACGGSCTLEGCVCDMPNVCEDGAITRVL